MGRQNTPAHKRRRVTHRHRTAQPVDLVSAVDLLVPTAPAVIARLEVHAGARQIRATVRERIHEATFLGWEPVVGRRRRTATAPQRTQRHDQRLRSVAPHAGRCFIVLDLGKLALSEQAGRDAPDDLSTLIT